MSTRTALVTGGSTGIGAAICRTLLDQGYDVVNLARRKAAFDSPRLKSLTVDLSDPVATREAAAQVAREQPITTIVHNAGAILEKAIDDVDAADIDTLAHLHLTAPLLLVQATLAAMRSAGFGRIVLISTRAVLGLAKRSAYASTKAGMLGLARTWSLELAPHGITVNVVSPGPIEDTEMFDGVLPKDSPRRAALAQSIPVRRLGRPEDVARAVAFFVDPAAGFITGQTLYVCGGTSVGSLAL